MQTFSPFSVENLRQLLTDGLQPVFRHSGDESWQLVTGEIGMLRMPAPCLRPLSQGARPATARTQSALRFDV